MDRRLLLPSKPESAARAAHFAEVAGAEAGLPAEALDRLVLATGEAVANAVRHGNRLDPKCSVRLRCAGDGTGCWLHVEDEGPGVEWTHFEEGRLPSDPYRTSGRGLYLMRVLSDRIVTGGGRLSLWFEPRTGESP